MPALSNPRHEAYCRNRAGGMKVYDSYINAGFEGNATGASQIETRPEVKARIQEMIEEYQTRDRAEAEANPQDNSVLDRQWILSQLRTNISKAQADGQISAANKALELMMDMLGLGPQKGKVPTGDDARKADVPQRASADHLTSVLDKLDQMTNAPEVEG